MLNLIDGLKEKAFKFIKPSSDTDIELDNKKDKTKSDLPQEPLKPNDEFLDLYQALDKATDLINYVKKTASTVRNSIEDNKFINDLDDMQCKFIEENKNVTLENGHNLWEGHPKEETLKKQILALSQDSRNFLRNPPEGCDYVFDIKQFLPFAKNVLKHDSRLAIMRFKLVPTKIKEEVFWRNYFYRVSLIKHSITLYEGMSQDETKQEHTTKNALDLVNHNNDSEDDDDVIAKTIPPIEFISDNILPTKSSEANFINIEANQNPSLKGTKQNMIDSSIDDDDEIEKMLDLKEFEMIKSNDTYSEEWDEEMEEMLKNQKI